MLSFKEVEAVFFPLKLARDRGALRVFVFSNAMEVVNAINGERDWAIQS